MASARRQKLGHTATALAFTVGMFVLVAFAVADALTFANVALFVVVAVGALTFYLIFPGSRLFTIAFANLLAVYICLFVFFSQVNFGPVTAALLPVGFALPIIAFLVGAEVRRRAIRRVVLHEDRSETQRLGRGLGWLIPVFCIGVATFFFPEMGLSQGQYDAAFLAAMAAIAAVVGLASRDVTTFLLDTGLLFEEFFERIAGLMVPAFAFFTFYTLNIVVFAAVYRIIDRFSAVGHFRIQGQPQELGFPDALYFSVITLSTVGYGEIVPASDLTKVIVSIQIVSGVLLLLFGFSEIISYTRERRQRRPEPK